jgi:ankyrin repeat protein
VTALVVAVESHDADAVQALLEGGASCDDTDASGKSVREVARATDWEDTPDMVSREKQILHLLKTQCAR